MKVRSMEEREVNIILSQACEIDACIVNTFVKIILIVIHFDIKNCYSFRFSICRVYKFCHRN